MLSKIGLFAVIMTFSFHAFSANNPDLKDTRRAQSLTNIWQANAGKTLEFNQFQGKDSRGDFNTAEVQVQLKFPESGDSSRLHVTVQGFKRTLFAKDYTAENSSGLWRTFKGARDGADFEIAINSYGDVNVRLWSGFGSIEERHAITDYRHTSFYDYAHAEGATLTCGTDRTGGASERSCSPRYRSHGSCQDILKP